MSVEVLAGSANDAIERMYMESRVELATRLVLDAIEFIPTLGQLKSAEDYIGSLPRETLPSYLGLDEHRGHYGVLRNLSETADAYQHSPIRFIHRRYMPGNSASQAKSVTKNHVEKITNGERNFQYRNYADLGWLIEEYVRGPVDFSPIEIGKVASMHLTGVNMELLEQTGEVLSAEESKKLGACRNILKAHRRLSPALFLMVDPELPDESEEHTTAAQLPFVKDLGDLPFEVPADTRFRHTGTRRQLRVGKSHESTFDVDGWQALRYRCDRKTGIIEIYEVFIEASGRGLHRLFITPIDTPELKRVRELGLTSGKAPEPVYSSLFVNSNGSFYKVEKPMEDRIAQRLDRNSKPPLLNRLLQSFATPAEAIAARAGWYTR